MKIVFLGLSITSSWGNGHATNYRALVRALRARGHEALFLERDVPWYASQRDAPAAGGVLPVVGGAPRPVGRGRPPRRPRRRRLVRPRRRGRRRGGRRHRRG